MNDPALVVMAAGMGSRFGGLKQVAPVDDMGHAILDFSLYDARRAGFRRVVFVIKREIEEDFKETVGQRMERYFDVAYVYQELGCLPAGYAVPEGRVKPWGTGHAVACCRGAVDGPFAVINADDFYGPGAFRAIFAFLDAPGAADRHAMVGYRLRNTLTEHGSVARGICAVREGRLISVTERTRVERRGGAAAYIEDGAEHPLTGDETVSMNFWGFASPAFLDRLWAGFPAFLDAGLAYDPLRCEYFLPAAVQAAMDAGECAVTVLHTDEIWHGVTYREDLSSVRDAVAEMKKTGVYPEKLWE